MARNGAERRGMARKLKGAEWRGMARKLKGAESFASLDSTMCLKGQND